MFENAGSDFRFRDAALCLQVAFFANENNFAGGDVPNQFETQDIDSDTFRSDNILGSQVGLALPEHDRPDPMRVAKTDDTDAGDHGDRGVTAAAAFMDTLDGTKNIVGVDAKLARALQFVSKNVEEYFGVGFGVYVSEVVLK